MSVAECGHDPGWFFLRVYDDHQPTAWSYVLLEEPFSVRPGVWFLVIWRGDRVEDRPQMGLKLGMAGVRIEHVPQPGVLEEHDSRALRCRRLGEDGSSACLWTVGQGRWLSGSFAWGRSTQPGYPPDRTRDHSMSRPRAPTAAATNPDEPRERLFTMAYSRPGFAEPPASTRSGSSKSDAKAQKTAPASQI